MQTIFLMVSRKLNIDVNIFREKIHYGVNYMESVMCDHFTFYEQNATKRNNCSDQVKKPASIKSLESSSYHMQQ